MTLLHFSSDINLKEISSHSKCLDKVGLITGYTYNWKSVNYDYLNGKAYGVWHKMSKHLDQVLPQQEMMV